MAGMTAEEILREAFKLADQHIANQKEMIDAEAQLANHVLNQYKAFQKVGFSNEQAFELVKEVVKVFV
jgi:hypothetical protein